MVMSSRVSAAHHYFVILGKRISYKCAGSFLTGTGSSPKVSYGSVRKSLNTSVGENTYMVAELEDLSRLSNSRALQDQALKQRQ